MGDILSLSKTLAYLSLNYPSFMGIVYNRAIDEELRLHEKGHPRHGQDTGISVRFCRKNPSNHHATYIPTVRTNGSEWLGPPRKHAGDALDDALEYYHRHVRNLTDWKKRAVSFEHESNRLRRRDALAEATSCTTLCLVWLGFIAAAVASGRPHRCFAQYPKSRSKKS